VHIFQEISQVLLQAHIILRESETTPVSSHPCSIHGQRVKEEKQEVRRELG